MNPAEKNTLNQILLTEQDLMQWTGYSRRADLEKWLTLQGIKPVHGKGGTIITTLNAVNDALKLAPKSNEFNDFEFIPHGQIPRH